MLKCENQIRSYVSKYGGAKLHREIRRTAEYMKKENEQKKHNKFAGKINCEMKTMESALQIYTSTFNVHLASN